MRSNGIADALPLPLQRAVLRIVQEALSNVHRHASASRVSVNLKCLGNRMHLVISDDGRGIEKALDHNGESSNLGVGITGMTTRMQQLGGKLHIRSGRKGTTVHAVVPTR
jgi:signal transduction histidine kinase